MKMKVSIVTVLVFIIGLYTFSQNESGLEKLAFDYLEKGLEFRHSQKDSAYHYLELATDYSLETKNYSQALDILIESIFASGIHYDLKKYRFYLEEMETLLQEDSILRELKDPEFYKNTLVYEEGSYLTELRDYEGAKTKFRKLYESYNDKEVGDLDYDNLAFLIYSSNLLASIYNDLGKYDLALSYFNKSLQIIEKNKLAKAEGFDRATNRLLAQLYIDMGKNNEADTILRDLLISYKELYKEDKEYKNSLVVVYQRMVENLVQQDSLKRAIDYLTESQKYLIDDDPFSKRSLLLYGDIYSKLGDEEKAFDHYQKALFFFKEYRQQKPNQDIAEVQGKIAEFHLRRENYFEGLKTLQNALVNSGRQIELDDYSKNPHPDKVFSKRQLLQLLDVKLQLLQLAYIKTGDDQNLRSALSTTNDILNTFDVLKKEFESKLDKQFLAETAYPIFHRMLAVTFEAYNKTPTRKIFELALNISEKNKDFLLLEALRSANATQYGGVPEKIIEKEARLRAEISNLEKKLFDASKEASDFSKDLFQLKQEYYGFLDTLKSHYPKYHDLKYQIQTLNLKTVANSLQDDEVLISFTLDAKHLYALTINATTHDFVKLPFDERDRVAVRNFYRSLSTPAITDKSKMFIESGKLLFKKILQQPILNFDSKNLTIVPDGVLHYLPFDMLVHDTDFLLRSKNIGYANSVNSYLELKGKESDTAKLLAFAPSFDNEIIESEIRFEFGKLLYNRDEVKKIGAVFDTEIYSDENATLQKFKTIAPKFNMIHLATHASANDEFPDYSYLAFTERDGEGSVLYIKDLYNTSLNAEMVTLSACQTGIGKLRKGQGMLSLSKGFYYAGAKSLVNTLWKINDKSSVKLMEYFYESLSEGKNKKEALREAKLKYLETTEDNLLKHPYYWSAFVVSGDPSPITDTDYRWHIAAGALFFLALFTFSLSKRNKNNRVKLP